jgi:hypothetical protein
VKILFIPYEGILRIGGPEVIRRMANLLIGESNRLHTFLSYAREDEEFVIRLQTALESHGLRVWLDRLEIQAGERQVAALEEAIAASRAVVFVFSRAGLASRWVRREYELAVELSNNSGSELRLVPILLGTTPEELPGFAKTLSVRPRGTRVF